MCATSAKDSASHSERESAAHLRLLSCNILAGGSVKRYREYVKDLHAAAAHPDATVVACARAPAHAHAAARRSSHPRRHRRAGVVARRPAPASPQHDAHRARRAPSRTGGA